MNTKLITNLLFCGLLLGQTLSAADIWVAPNGSDLNDGTKEHPLASVEIAVRHARELRRLSDPSIAGGIHIILKNGIYQPVDAIQLRPEDAGTAASPTWIEAAPGEKPIISGGIQISGWKKASNLAGFPKAAQGKVWVADAVLTFSNEDDGPPIFDSGLSMVERLMCLDEVDIFRVPSCAHDDYIRLRVDLHAKMFRIPVAAGPVSLVDIACEEVKKLLLIINNAIDQEEAYRYERQCCHQLLVHRVPIQYARPHLWVLPGAVGKENLLVHS